MNEGLGYKRIHKVLVKEGFEVGKSPNCVNSMIKKRLKREKLLTHGNEEGLRTRKDDIDKYYNINNI